MKVIITALKSEAEKTHIGVNGESIEVALGKVVELEEKFVSAIELAGEYIIKKVEDVTETKSESGTEGGTEDGGTN